jgi:hypothetical protein
MSFSASEASRSKAPHYFEDWRITRANNSSALLNPELFAWKLVSDRLRVRVRGFGVAKISRNTKSSAALPSLEAEHVLDHTGSLDKGPLEFLARLPWNAIAI